MARELVPAVAVSVWSELVDARAAAAEAAGRVDTDLLPEPDGRTAVVLGEVPTGLLLRAKTHADHLVRDHAEP